MGTLNKTTRSLNNNTRSVLVLTQAEPITGDNTYRSPNLYVSELNPLFTENVDYTGGSALYTGLDTITILIRSTVSIKASNSGTQIFVTSGTNGTASTVQEIESLLTNANEIKELTHQGVFTLAPGDTMDFFIKASSNVTLEKAVWNIQRFD